MAYSSTKTTKAATNENIQKEAVEVKETKTETASSVILAPKQKIPLDAQIMVKNLTGGKLVYESKRLRGYSEVWHEFGEEIPMEMAELYSMKNTDRKFFTENWIEVDMAVLRDLQMDRFYQNAMTVDEINNMFELNIDELVSKVSNMSMALRNSIGIKAMEMIEDGRLSNVKTINALEKALNCELYER